MANCTPWALYPRYRDTVPILVPYVIWASGTNGLGTKSSFTIEIRTPNPPARSKLL
jgi:hypothetical protein